jgi:hypothetical protein
VGFENGSVLRVTLRALNGAEEQVNTYHYDIEDPSWDANNVDPQALADRFRDDVVPAFKALYSDSWFVQPVIVTEEKDPQNPTATRRQWNSGSPVAGTYSPGADLLPHQMCVVVTNKSDHIGRRYTGRNFYGGALTETQQNNGVWGSGWTDLVQAVVDAIPKQPDLDVGYGWGSARYSVYSRTQRAANADPYLSEITSSLVRSSVHWLRRRTP